MCYPLKTQAPISLLDETQEEKYRVIAVNSFWISRVHSDYHSHTGLSSGMAVHTLERGRSCEQGGCPIDHALLFYAGHLQFACLLNICYWHSTHGSYLQTNDKPFNLHFPTDSCWSWWNGIEKEFFFSFAHLLQMRTDHNLLEKNVNAL